VALRVTLATRVRAADAATNGLPWPRRKNGTSGIARAGTPSQPDVQAILARGAIVATECEATGERVSGDSGQRFSPPGAAPFDTPASFGSPSTGLSAEPEPPMKGKGKIVAAVMIGVIVLIVLAVVALKGGDDSSGGGSSGGSGSYPTAVRSDPSDKKKTVEIDDGLFAPGTVMGGNLIVADLTDGQLSAIRGIDLSTGKKKWSHDAQAARLVGKTLFIIDGGTLTTLDSNGKTGKKELSVDDGANLDKTQGMLVVFQQARASIVDTSTLKIVAEDIWLKSCSENGKYCTRIESGDGADESDVSLIEVSTGKKVGKSLTVTGDGNSFALGDGRIVVLDGGDLVLYSKAGKELSREEVADGATIDQWFGERVIVGTGDGQPQLWSINNKLENLGDGPQGLIALTSDKNTVIVDTDEDGVMVCPVDNDGFECLDDSVDGHLESVANGVFYVNDSDTIVAYDLTNTKKPLWSLDLEDDQSFQALDGKIALVTTDTDAGTTTIDVYG
jgi:hypothetical protein